MFYLNNNMPHIYMSIIVLAIYHSLAHGFVQDFFSILLIPVLVFVAVFMF